MVFTSFSPVDRLEEPDPLYRFIPEGILLHTPGHALAPAICFLVNAAACSIPGVEQAFAFLAQSRLEGGQRVLNTGAHDLPLYSRPTEQPATISSAGAVRTRRPPPHPQPRVTQTPLTAVSPSPSSDAARLRPWHDAAGHSLPIGSTPPGSLSPWRFERGSGEGVTRTAFILIFSWFVADCSG